jgi:hypothetical protein
MPSRTNALKRELHAIQVALRQLQRSFDRLAPALAARAAGGTPPRRKMQMTPARRAALKLQGQYMGYMRNLKPQQKAKVKKIRAVKGIRAAITAAKRLGS